MAEDKHDFSLFRKGYAHPEAEERFLTIDKQWLERQLMNEGLKTIIIDNTNKTRTFSVCEDVITVNDKKINCLALKLENPKGEDIVCLGLCLFKFPTTIGYLKFRNVQTAEQVPPARMLLNAFLNRKLKCILLEKNIHESFMLQIFDVANISDQILLRGANIPEQAMQKLLSVDNFAIGSDDEADAECAAASAATRAGR